MKKVRKKLFVAGLILGSVILAEAQQNIQVEVHPKTSRAIGGKLNLDRKKYFNLSANGTGIEGKIGDQARIETYFKELKMTLGRDLGMVGSEVQWGNSVFEDPNRPGNCYASMIAPIAGLGVKGVIFHQGYNNAMSSNCRPKRYRVLMKLMVEGWREDFEDPNLPVAVIGFCAGGDPQHEDNFEEMSYGGAPYIREAQRLGLADVGDPENTVFIPAYDVQVPGLHPGKKREHGLRAARWAHAKYAVAFVRITRS